AFIYKLVETLSKQMSEFFPELKKQKNIIYNVIKEEENSFLRTLAQGLLLLDTVIKENKGSEIPGDKAFELYDTFGFPIDLTALILQEKGYTLDQEGFKTALDKQKNRSRAATKVETGDWEILIDDPVEEFVGYDLLETPVKLTRYRKVDSKKEGTMYQLVFNITPFYAEGGGQVGDKGYLQSSDGDIVYILDTKKENNLIIPLAKPLPKNLHETFTAVVDAKQRERTAANHSATHLLHQALRSVLGDHVQQKGSMVRSGYLRFDFSHFSKLTSEELAAVADFVNARIKEHLPLEENRQTPYNLAIENGAMALFGEKYGDVVRTIKFGDSIELCGGTHVKNTRDIWHFIITSEGAVAAGVRRIEAIAYDTAQEYFTTQTAEFQQVKDALKGNSSDPLKAVTALQEENSALKKQIEQLLKEKAKSVKST